MCDHRLSRCVGIALAAAAVALLAAWVVGGGVAAAQQDQEAAGPEAQKPLYDGTPMEELRKPPIMDMPPQWDSPKREKMIANLMRRLGRMKPYGNNKKKDLDDYFLVATGDVDMGAKSADVRFMVLHGARKTAEFVVDYVAAAPQGVLRKWHVFGRFKDDAVANEALASARLQYDQMVAYRELLERIYSVRSTRRC